MLRRGCSGLVVAPTRALTVAPVMNNAARTDLTFFTYYWWPSWAMGIWYPLATVWPLFIADILKPSATASKLPVLHAFHEKRVEMKLRAALDSAVTQWSDELDTANIDSAISRTF
jgi:hypothetical protein